MKLLHEWTLEDVRNLDVETVIYTETTDPESNRTGLFVIARGGVGLCAYLCVPTNHPLAALDFDANSYVHGGETYDAPAWWDHELWAWGWDYAHLGDAAIFTPEAQRVIDEVKASFKKPEVRLPWQLDPDRVWLPHDVWADSREACAALNEAMREAEREAERRAAAGEPPPEPRRGRTREGRDWVEARFAADREQTTP